MDIPPNEQASCSNTMSNLPQSSNVQMPQVEQIIMGHSRHQHGQHQLQPRAHQIIQPQAHQIIQPQAHQIIQPQTHRMLRPQATQMLRSQSPRMLRPQAPQMLRPQLYQQRFQRVPKNRPNVDLHTVIPDIYAKVKSFMVPLRETLTKVMETAALIIKHKTEPQTDSLDITAPLHDVMNKSLEDFYSYCNQIEYNLKLLIELQSQSTSSRNYIPLPVIIPRTEKAFRNRIALTYPEFLTTIKNQISFAQQIHDSLMSVAQSMAPED